MAHGPFLIRPGGTICTPAFRTLVLVPDPQKSAIGAVQSAEPKNKSDGKRSVKPNGHRPPLAGPAADDLHRNLPPAAT